MFISTIYYQAQAKYILESELWGSGYILFRLKWISLSLRLVVLYFEGGESLLPVLIVEQRRGAGASGGKIYEKPGFRKEVKSG